MTNKDGNNLAPKPTLSPKLGKKEMPEDSPKRIHFKMPQLTDGEKKGIHLHTGINLFYLKSMRRTSLTQKLKILNSHVTLKCSTHPLYHLYCHDVKHQAVVVAAKVAPL